MPAVRIGHYDSGVDRIASELRQIAEPSHVDNYADTKADVLLGTLQEIQQFRDTLYGTVLADLAGRVSLQTEELQQRLRWILDADELWRDLLSLARHGPGAT